MQIQDESYIKWKLFLEGNDEAYSWLYTHHIQLLYQYGLQITPDTEVIKDCIQDVFIRIYKNKNKLSIPQNVKIYLMISLKNSIYNVFSKERSEESYAFNFYSMEEQYITENEDVYKRQGCTGEIISPEGLILTNHHCGYASIQQHSSVEHDYLTDGFWATSRDKELPTPGLKFTFIERIEDITDIVNAKIAAKEIKMCIRDRRGRVSMSCWWRWREPV